MRTGCQAHAERVDKVLTAGLVSARIGLGHHINQSMGMGNRPARELWEISLMNTKIKVLSLVLGTAFAGSAAAVCPSSPVPPWTAVASFQGTATIVDGGLSGTECRLDSAISAGAGGTAAAAVQDDSPATETRYRAQFMIDLDALAAPTLNTQATVLNAISDTTGTGVTIGIFGNGGVWNLSVLVPNATDPSGIATLVAPLASGENHVEFDFQVGGSGSMTLWVNNNVEGSPTAGPVTVDNNAVGGIDTAFLGLGAPSNLFVTNYAGIAAGFDQFDSRRTTFIGF